MKVLVTGANGQLGRELRETNNHHRLVLADRATLDITDEARVMAYTRAEAPDIIINTAAYTAVDKAESEPGFAYAVNSLGPRYLALAARTVGAQLIHVSTDFVFDGRASRPYRPQHETAPLSVYGQTKREGENAIRAELPRENFLILRTAWVYSAYGTNFVKTMLRLMNQKNELGVIGDQVGTPTWARSLAVAIWHAIESRLVGVHHWTDAGIASWYDFAMAIYQEGRALGVVHNNDVAIRQIATEDYPAPARRPAYGVLDKSETWAALGGQPPHWRVHLRQMLEQVRDEYAA